MHTHTTHCDGKLSAEEMIKAAIRKGGSSLGFSEHMYVHFDDDYSMTPEATKLYVDEVRQLKTKYAGQIEIFLGIEQDYFGEPLPGGLDYVIGGVHWAQADNGDHIAMDNTLDGIQRVRDEHFGGDMLAVTERYYATISEIADKTGADIIAHFDLIAKRNSDGRLFDETAPRYVKAALDALDKIMERCKLFEINTGAMYRFGRTSQYPSRFLLCEIQKRGGEILFSSDSHDGDSIYHKFDEMRELALSCSFTHYKILTTDGFINAKL